MIRPFAYLIPLYATAVGAKNAAYERRWAKPQRLGWPVVSVGNLSVGGAGKTPLVIRLAQLLKSEGARVDVLSRGYGRRDSGRVERVDPEGDAARFGDEPLLIARATGVPVYVGASRYEAGLLAERESGTGIHLLDDGFQHRKLARDLDVVVVHASDFEETLLPAGRLREPLSALRRASVVVLRAEDRGLEVGLRKRGISAPVWIQHRRLVTENATRAVAFCGIARPEDFFVALRDQGVEAHVTIAMRDHQSYSNTDIKRLANAVRESGAECLVTTEKDAARLTLEQHARLEEIAPLRVARLEVSLEDEGTAVRRLLDLL